MPYEMRKLGDDYVRNEFKQHKVATDSRQLADFFEAWDGYLETMKLSAPTGKFGRELGRDEVSDFNDEQRIKLAQLREETKSNSS